MPTIVVTPRSLSLGDHPLLARLREAGYQLAFPSPGRQPTRAQLQASMADAVGYLAGVERIDAALLAAAPSLRVISRNGTGLIGRNRRSSTPRLVRSGSEKALLPEPQALPAS